MSCGEKTSVYRLLTAKKNISCKSGGNPKNTDQLTIIRNSLILSQVHQNTTRDFDKTPLPIGAQIDLVKQSAWVRGCLHKSASFMQKRLKFRNAGFSASKRRF